MSRTKRILAAGLVAALLATGAGAAPKPLARSIYVPVTFHLCNHLENGILYQDEQAVARMPARRIFQFTFYPELERMLPEVVQVRVEGAYADADEPFVARLAVTAEGVHTARRVTSHDTAEQMKTQRHKLDARLEHRDIRLVCQRFCRSKSAASAAESESSVQ